jgi:hypothetical protein
VAILDPRSTVWSHQATFRGNDQTRGIGVQRLRDQYLIRLRAVTIRSVNEIYAQLDRPMQNPIGVVPIPWSSPSRISA